MKLLVPDLHNHINYLKYALENFYTDRGEPDQMIYLGDYFDNFNDDEFIVSDTARWLKKELKNENNIFLLGNHDARYMVPHNLSLYCPGYTTAKSKAINSILTQDDWSKIRPYYFVDDFLITHAGVHSSFTPYYPNSTDWKQDLFKYIDKGFEKIKTGLAHELFLPGDRMGENRRGGLTWQDWDTEFVIIDGLNQIVGHSPNSTPRFKIKENSFNCCLDTHLKHFGILENGKLKTYNTITGEIV